MERLLGTHLGAEASLGDDVVRTCEGYVIGDDRRVAVSDVGERAAVDEGGVALEGLDEVRHQRLSHQQSHRSGGTDVVGGNRIAGVRLGDDDAPDAGAQIHVVLRQREYGHHLAGRGDVEAVGADDAVGSTAQTDGDLPQAAVVHVDGAGPVDSVDVDVQLVAPMEVVVDDGRAQVVG